MEIWDAKGNKVLDSVVTQNAEHVEELMQADYVSLQWVSNVKRVLPAGAYIVPFDDGVRYMLLDPYTPDQNNTDEFTYSPQFQHPKMYLGRVPYTRASKDTEGNDINLLDWDYKGYLTTFLSDLCGFITKTFTDEGITSDKFSYSILGDIEGNVTISISNNDVLSVLNNVCNTLDCEWHVDWEQRRLFVGNIRFDKNEGSVLELTSGVNVGMASVSSQKDTHFNVYLPQGSTRNMAAATSDGSYYATNRRLELDPEKYPDGKIYTDGEGNVVTKEQFLDAKLPKLVQTLMLDEIYPKIDLYAYDVRNRERYLLDDNGDKVIDHYEGETPVYKRYAIWYMRLAYPIYNTDGTIRSWKDATLGDTFKLIDGYTLMCSFGANTDSTLTSPLAGREFELNCVETDKEAKELSAKADSDKGDTGVEVKKGDFEIIYTTERNLIIPTTEEQGLVPKGESSPSKNGNMVTIFNVVMGEDFIKAAQNDLEVAAIREIKKQYSDLNQYTFNSDNVAFKKDMPSLYIGRSVRYNDGVGNTLDTRIMKLTTKLDFPFMVEITVGNKVLKGSTSQLKTDVQMILSGNRQTASNGITESVVRSLIKGFGGANFLSKVNDDTARGIITFLQGTNWGSFTSETGAAMTVDPTTGQTYMEVDRLKVRLKAFFEQLEVQKVGYVGGKIVVSKGQGVDILDVEEIYDSEGNLSAYRCYFLGEQEGKRINNLLRVNDQMICKDENISEGSTDGATNKYYWRLATAVSSDVVKRGNNVCHWVDLSATDCDTNSDVPEIGDTICHLGNRNNIDRQGAEVLSVVDANSPSFTIYAGIDSYSLVNKEYIDMGVSEGKAYCNIYGSTYIGDRERKSGYLRWNDDTKTFEIKGTIDITSPLSSGGTIGGAIDNAANAYKGEFDAFTNNVNEVIGGFQAQIDGVIETWFYEPEPTLGNEPAVNWTDNATKDKHLGDLYYSKEGKAYRFQKDGDNYVWQIITDTDITKALEEAKKANDAANAAQGTADSKMRVFTTTALPTPPYDKKDLWVQGENGDIMVCVKEKASGATASASDWEKASKYTDDTKANEALTKVGDLQTDVTELGESFNTLTNTTLPALSDGIITTSEKENIRQALMQVQKECVDVINAYTNLTVNYKSIYDKIAADVRTNFATAYTNLMGGATLSSDGTITYTSGQGGAYGALVDNINALLNKEGNLTTNEIATINNNIANFNIKYNDFQNRLVVVRNDIEKTLDTRITDVDEQLGGYAYLKKIVGGKTTIDGGLVLTTMLGTGYEVTGGAYKIMSGISGLYETAKSVAIWAGGSMIDKFVYYDAESGKFNVPADVNPANFLVRMDGTGYAAGGNFWWDNDGKIHADPQSFLINEQYVGNVMQLFQLHYKVAGDTGFTNVDYVTPTRMFNGLELSDLGLKIGDTAKFYIKDGVLFLEGDLAVTGGITMYASNGVTSGLLDQVYAILDSSKFEIENGVITIKGEIGDGKVKGATLGGVAVTLNANGILEFDAYPTTLPASDVYAWAKAANKPTYSWGEITEKPTSFTPSAHTHDDLYYTESEIDTKLGLKLDTSLKGAADGLATLDSSGKVPSSQLPSYVDDVLEYANKASFPTKGESGKIYIDKATNLTYRWGGTAYVEISQSLALGETSSTAYAGDKGKQNAEDIAELQTGKADKATTLSGYGITDAYTNTEVDTKLTDGSVTKVGTTNVGATNIPIYLKAGVPTAVTLADTANNLINNLSTGTSTPEDADYYISQYVGGGTTTTTFHRRPHSALYAYIKGKAEGTWEISVSGNAATATTLQNARTLWGQSFNGSANISGNMSGVGQITFSDLTGTNGRSLLYQKMADNDYFRIYAGGTATNGGYVEIATADDGNEPIYVRQYSGVFSSVVRTLTLLDGSGNTTVPGLLTAANGTVNGTLKVGAIPVTNSSTGVLKIDGSLIVTGGITMYATDGVASGLMEQILVDGTTIGKKADGTLYAINTGNVRSIIMGSTTYTPNDSGAVTLPEKVTWANIEGKPSTFTPSAHTHAISDITDIGNASVNYATSAGNANYANSAGNADTLDGCHAYSFLIDRGGNYTGLIYDLPCKSIFSGFNLTDAPTTGWVSGLILGSNWNSGHYQHYLVESGSRWYATRDASDGKMTNWNTFAYITDNVASATKLQTARTIWGHSFDGTGDIATSQSAKMPYVLFMNRSNDKFAGYCGRGGSGSDQIYLTAYSGNAVGIGANNTDNVIYINTSLNVGIGTESPSYKLHVAGDIYTTTGFKKNGSSDSYVLLGGGGHKAESSLSVASAASATKLTSSAGSATLPIYFSDGKPVACTAASVFSNLTNSGNNISVTVAGQNRTLTVGYADTVDGYHASNIMQAGWIGLYRTGGSASTIKWTRIGRFITTANDNPNNDAMIEFFSNGDQNYTYFGHGRLMLSSYSTGSSNMMLTSVSDGDIHFYATIDANRYIWLGHNAWWTGNSKYRVLFTGSFVEWYSSSLTVQTTNPNDNYITDNGTFKYNAAMSTASSGSSHSWVWQYNSRVAYATSAGNSDTCDGLHVHGGRNNEANKIVRTDGSGYLQVGYINSSSGNEGNNSSPARVWGTNGSDNYMRTYLTSALSVNYAASAGTASYANYLNSNSRMEYGWNGVNYFNAYLTTGCAAKANDAPSSAWWHIMRFNHGNSQGYYTDLAIPFNDNSLYWKCVRSGSLAHSSWVKVLDSLNYNEYAPTKTGTGASGTWGIAISGNAATASKWATARTITLTGSVTGSVSIDGSGNVTLATTTNHTHSYLPLSGGTMTGTIHANDGAQNTGIKFKSNNANLNALGDQHLILGKAIRFGAYNTWDWNAWAGLKYDHSNKTIYLGLADGTIFNANAAQSGGTICFPAVSTVRVDSNTRVAQASNNLYIGTSNNAGWVFLQDMASQIGTGYWKITQAGDASFKGSVTATTFNGALNGNAASATNADQLDGVHYENILERRWTKDNSLSQVGWYRIAQTNCTDGQGCNFILFINRGYSNTNNECYVYSVSMSFGGNISFTQLSGSANSRLISKIRIDKVTEKTSYIDIYYTTTTSNWVRWTTIGGATCVTATYNPTLAGTAYEFATSDGISTNKNILAGGGITMYSDLRKKNILSDEVLSVKEIAAAPLFAHTYKSDENHYLHIGTSAQYWSAIHEGWFTRKDSEGYYQMELQNLGVAMGISLAREVIKYESKTDKKIRLMKKKINDLEAANKALDARIKELEGSMKERRTA